MAKPIKRRLTSAQSAVANQAGVSLKDAQELVNDDEYIVLIQLEKSKGGNGAGYQLHRLDGEGRILQVDPTVYPNASTAMKKGREQWPAASIDEGKALNAFFAGFMERFNAFMNTTRSSAEVLALCNEHVDTAADE